MTPSSMKASATQLKESAQVLDESTAMHPKQQQYYLIMVLCLILKPLVTRDYPELSISAVSGWNMKDISKLDMNPDAYFCRQGGLEGKESGPARSARAPSSGASPSDAAPGPAPGAAGGIRNHGLPG